MVADECFETGPIRPPSEARSLLVRVTRNCAWNRCTFCPVYKGQTYSVRPVASVIRDIDLVHRYICEMRDNEECPGSLKSRWLIDATERADPRDLPALDMAYHWYVNGMESVFLQDADALSAGPEELETVLLHLRERFPEVRRVTSYARTSTILRYCVEDLKRLREAGLDRLHVGFESGSDRVLRMVRKGASKAMHISAAKMVKSAGIEFSAYIMPGLGGRRLSLEHAVETADLLNQVDPDFIRLRQLAVSDRSPLHHDLAEGRFETCRDVDVARELVKMLDHMDRVTGVLTSDHILNLFPEVTGKLPGCIKQSKAALCRFLNLSRSEQQLYALGRRLGVFSRVSELEDSVKADRVRRWAQENGITEDNVERFLEAVVQSFI
ncbi:MAG: radical SAM protein [Candidatus Thorarchaeota archaeon]